MLASTDFPVHFDNNAGHVGNPDGDFHAQSYALVAGGVVVPLYGTPFVLGALE